MKNAQHVVNTLATSIKKLWTVHLKQRQVADQVAMEVK